MTRRARRVQPEQPVNVWGARLAEEEMLHEKPYNASDPEQVNEARKKAGRRKREKLEYVAKMMSDPEGRTWLYRLLLACDVYRNSYRADEPEKGIYIREGRRDIGLRILADIKKASLDLYVEMLREAEKKELSPLYPVDALD